MLDQLDMILDVHYQDAKLVDGQLYMASFTRFQHSSVMHCYSHGKSEWAP